MITGGRFLVTGGGLIGSGIARRLLAAGAAEVRLMDVRDVRASLPVGVDFRLGDVRDRTAVAPAVAGTDAVFHTAAALTGALASRPELAVEVNVGGTAALLEAAAAAGVGRFVFSSSTAVHGDRYAMSPPWPSGAAITERTPFPSGDVPATFFVYATSKMLGEALCRTYEESGRLATVCLRYASPYGEDASAGMSARYLRACCEDLLAGRRPRVPGDGSDRRDLVHVDDVAEANLLAAASTVPGRSYLIASGVSTPLLDVVRTLIRVSGAAVEPELVPAQGSALGEAGHAWPYDVSAAASDLGWRPRVSLEEGLRRMLERARREVAV